MNPAFRCAATCNLTFVALLCCVPCFGQDKTIRNATDLVALKARVAEAKARGQRLVVKVEPSLMVQKQLPLEQTMIAP